ncbi:hypothetical protein EV182_004776 [Spiromyces aspiralis]|uniref:Uncharacterized protein n=1 Tax=Spiromyces aspiralis TaxID=68401 RepID=A0ACC1HEC2_9FUNG|nr:hypothetical protein EV182_004776 [Spiromyces aspiralis]
MAVTPTIRAVRRGSWSSVTTATATLVLALFIIIGSLVTTTDAADSEILNPLLNNGKLGGSFNYNTPTLSSEDLASDNDSDNANDHDASEKDRQFCSTYNNICSGILASNQATKRGNGPANTLSIGNGSIAAANSIGEHDGDTMFGISHCTSRHHHFCCVNIPHNSVIVDECPHDSNSDNKVMDLIRQQEIDDISSSASHDDSISASNIKKGQGTSSWLTSVLLAFLFAGHPVLV